MQPPPLAHPQDEQQGKQENHLDPGQPGQLGHEIRLDRDDRHGGGGQREDEPAEQPEATLMAQGQDVGADETGEYPAGHRLPGQAERVDGYFPGHVRHELFTQVAYVLVELPRVDRNRVVHAQFVGRRP